MKIWRRKYNDHGYSIIEEDPNNYDLKSYNNFSIKDLQGNSYNVVNSLVENDELVLVVD